MRKRLKIIQCSISPLKRVFSDPVVQSNPKVAGMASGLERLYKVVLRLAGYGGQISV